jgi:hypothetical protein
MSRPAACCRWWFGFRWPKSDDGMRSPVTTGSCRRTSPKSCVLLFQYTTPRCCSARILRTLLYILTDFVLFFFQKKEKQPRAGTEGTTARAGHPPTRPKVLTCGSPRNPGPRAGRSTAWAPPPRSTHAASSAPCLAGPVVSHFLRLPSSSERFDRRFGRAPPNRDRIAPITPSAPAFPRARL